MVRRRSVSKWLIGLGQCQLNHLYWCAASSDGDGEMVSEKWLSILNHITNVHEGHGERFPKCLHGELEDRDWIKKGKFIVPIFLYELLVF